MMPQLDRLHTVGRLPLEASDTNVKNNKCTTPSYVSGCVGTGGPGRSVSAGQPVATCFFASPSRPHRIDH